MDSNDWRSDLASSEEVSQDLESQHENADEELLELAMSSLFRK